MAVKAQLENQGLHTLSVNLGEVEIEEELPKEELRQLDTTLRTLGSGLLILKGKPEIEIPEIVKQYKVQKVFKNLFRLSCSKLESNKHSELNIHLKQDKLKEQQGQ